MLQRLADDFLLKFPSFVMSLFVFVMILACMEQDYYYMDFYGE